MKTVFKSTQGNRFHVTSELGAVGGQSGEFYIAQRDGGSGSPYVVKVFDKRDQNAVDRARWLMDKRQVIQHPSVVLPVDYIDKPDCFAVISPYIDGAMEMEAWMSTSPSFIDHVVIAAQISQMMACLKNAGVFHGDLHSRNVLIVASRAYLIDFDNATGPGAPAAPMAGGHYSMAPERASGTGPVTEASECYALACLTHELLLSTSPFAGSGITDADIERARAGPWLHDPTNPIIDPTHCALSPKLLHPGVQQLFRDSLQPVAGRRPSVDSWFAALQFLLRHDRLVFCNEGNCLKPYMLHSQLANCPHCGCPIERRVLSPQGAVIDVCGQVALGRAHCAGSSVSKHHVTLERKGPELWLTTVSANSPTWIDQSPVGSGSQPIWKRVGPGKRVLLQPGCHFALHDQPFLVE